MPPKSHYSRCMCGNPQCFEVQMSLCESAGDESRTSSSTSSVWCEQPYILRFDWTTASFKTWLFVLGLSRHIRQFQNQLVSAAFMQKEATYVAINRIHFTRALLENRSVYDLKQPTTLINPSDAKSIASLDVTSRMMEAANTVGSLERFANSILPQPMLDAFIKSHKKGFDSYFVQAPVAPLSEAANYANHLAKGKGGVLSLKRKALPVYVTPSILVKRYKEKKDLQHDHLGFVAAIAASSVSSPPRLSCSTTTTGTLNPLSPFEVYPSIENCQTTIKDRYLERDTSRNFHGALTVLRNIHHDFNGILVKHDSNNNRQWLYPCSASCNPECIGYTLLSRKSRLPKSTCLKCRAKSRQEGINKWKKNKIARSSTRQQSISSMDKVEAKQALKKSKVQLRLSNQSIKRLQRHLKKKSPSLDFKNEGQAIEVVQQVFQYMSSCKGGADATTTMLRAMMEELHSEKRISIENKDDREVYADFIASDIKNACKRFAGESNQIRFHPIMANLAMNMYIGMSYKDMIDVTPFCFPTMRTVQRSRAIIATHEGTDPKVYAKVSEMDGFVTGNERMVHWLFDEVKLTSGISWNAKNDDFRGLCCGTTGSTSDLKDMMEEYLAPPASTPSPQKADQDELSTGIYCNQWMARNPFGSTLMAEFFYNEGGGLDGNEMMRQYLQVSTSATISGLDTIGLVSDMGGGNDRFYTLMNDGKKMNDDQVWPVELVSSTSPVDPSVEVHMWSCSTHGEKNIRSQLHKSRSNGSGTRQFISSQNDDFGWWNVERCLEKDTNRYQKGGTFRSDLTIQAVNLDAYSSMNASLAKAPFTAKTISAMMDTCAKNLALPVTMELRGDVDHQSGERLQRKLDELRVAAATSMDRSCVGSDLAAIEFCIAVHKIYHQRFMNPTWILTVDNIASEELALRDALMYFGDWRTAMMDGTLAPPGGGNVVQGKDRQRMCIASTTYKNLRFSVCGFITYAKKLLARGIDDIESGHSNTSALESRFSMAKRSGNNSTDTYHNVPSNQNIVMALKHAKKKDRKMVKGNTSYEPDSIATELSEPIGFARRVGDMMNSWKREAVIIASNASEMLLDQDDQYMLPLHLKKPVKSMLGVLLVAKLQSKAIPGKTIVNFLRNHQVVKDLMVLALSSSSIHQTWIHGLYGPSTKLWSEQLHFLLETAFQLLDASADSKKASHESSFWWQVANVMRNQSIHLMSPHPTCCSTHIRSYLFIFLAQQLLGWCKDLLDKHKEKQEEELVTADCWQRGKVMSIDFATIGHDVNSYFGYALHRVNREYRQYEEVGKGGDADEFELLTHMIAAGENIVSDQAYLNEYYDHYFNFLNQGGMTMVSPLYVKLFHTIFYEICLCLNKKKLFDEKDKKAMALARATVMNQLNGWVQEVQMIASSELQFEDPAKVCMKLLSKIITKVFNARTNTVLKRYQSTHLARGGCTSSKSSMREERKHEGKGRKKVHS